MIFNIIIAFAFLVLTLFVFYLHKIVIKLVKELKILLKHIEKASDINDRKTRSYSTINQ